MNFPQMRLFIRERRALARVAPHLVRPLPFVVPTYRGLTRARRWSCGSALAINDIVSRDRHDGLADPGLQLPPGAIVSRDECLRLNPVVDPARVTGGAVWHDYQMHNTDRMTFSFVLSAAAAGATTANYVKAARVDASRAAACHGRARRGPADAARRSTSAPRRSLNAAGPWAHPALQDRSTPAAHVVRRRGSRAR